jgi:hypothetical protein
LLGVAADGPYFTSSPSLLFYNDAGWHDLNDFVGDLSGGLSSGAPHWETGLGGRVWGGAQGNQWPGYATGTTSTLHAVQYGAGGVWAVGDQGAMVFNSGPVTNPSWAVVPSVTAANLNGLWSTWSGQLWAVGDQGTILHVGPLSKPAAAECGAIVRYVSDPVVRDLNECELEYGIVGAASRGAIDTYAACAASNPPGTNNWSHGACQSQAAAAIGAVTADPALAPLQCVLSADTSNGYVLPNGCHLADGAVFDCSSLPDAGQDYGRCCMAVYGDPPCFLSNYNYLNVHSY